MAEEKKKGLGIMIALGKPKPDEPPPLGKGLLDNPPMPEDEESLGEEEPSAFDEAAGEAFQAAANGDREGFIEALKLAIESKI